MYDSLFRQFGVYRADSIEEFFEIARSCVIGTRPANERVAMVTVSGELRAGLARYFGFYNTKRRHSALDRRTLDAVYFDQAHRDFAA